MFYIIIHMNEKPSPLELAQNLVNQIEQTESGKKIQEDKERVENLRTNFEDEKQKQSEFTETVENLSKTKLDTNRSIKDSVIERKKIQKEGKEAGKVIREKIPKINFKEDENIQKIFGPIIARLKELNEKVKEERVFEGETKTSLQKQLEKESKDAFHVLRDFQEKHPELSKIYRKNESLNSSQEYATKNQINLEKLKDTLSEYKNNIITSSKDEKIKDLTAEKLVQDLEKKENVQEENRRAVDKEITDLKDKGKGFFESQKSFDKKIDDLKTKYNSFSDAYNNLYNEKRKILNYNYELKEEYFDNLKRAFNSDNAWGDKMNKYFEENKEVTLGALFDEALKINKDYIDTLKLTEEENLLIELEKLLQKHESNTRVKSYIEKQE